MKTIFQINLLFWLAMTVVAQPKILQTYEWKDLSAQVPNSQIVMMDGVSVLKIVKTNDEPLVVSLLSITNAALIHKANSIQWDMKYENVPFGALRAWDEIYPPQAVGGDRSTNQKVAYFNAGSANWDKYEFTIFPARYDNQTQPGELELGLTLPRSGTIYLRPIKLIGWRAVSNWWSVQQAGLIGGIGGAVVGCLGVLVGVLGSKGRARGLVLGTVKFCIALGLLALAGGVTALVLKQPYEVYYPMLLGGFILTIVFSVNLPAIHRRYDELEIRRMASEDAMRG